MFKGRVSGPDSGRRKFRFVECGVRVPCESTLM